MSTPERDYDDFDLPGCEEYYDEGDVHDAEPAEPEDGPEVRLAEGSSDEEPEYCERPDSDGFADACGMMTQEDWDADNDWLASAGWGEM